MTLHSRRLGRLFSCLLALALAAPAARADDPARTIVSDTLYRADGTVASGTLLISWPAFVSADGKPVAAGSMNVHIGASGQVNIPLVPTQGATPAGSYYKVVVKLDDGASSTEYWSVPTLSPTTIAAIRSSVVPASVALQVVSREYVDSADAAGVHKSGDETIAGVKTFETSPLVPAPAAETAAANKNYVDAAVASGGSGILALNKGGTGNSSWTSARCVRVAGDGSKLESAAGDCGADSDTLDGQHASAFLANPAGNAGDALVKGAAGWQAQSKATIDVRDIPGIDCTGATDSSSGLNTLFNTLSAKKVKWPTGCKLRANSQINVSGQGNWEWEGEGFIPLGDGPGIFGCGAGAGGPMIYINRSNYWRISGLAMVAKMTGCTSNFTSSIQFDNDGGGGQTSTRASIERNFIASNANGAAITNYNGVIIGPNGNNLENIYIGENWINCQGSQNSYGIRLAGGNADAGEIYRNQIQGCHQGVRHETGNFRIVNNWFTNVGMYSWFGAHGAVIYNGGCVSGPLSIMYNESSDSGPFINSGNDATNAGCYQVNLVGNVAGIASVGPGEFPVNLGTRLNGYYVLVGNEFNVGAGPTTALIGSNAFGGNHPGGTLIDIANFNRYPANTLGYTQPIGFSEGEYHLGGNSNIGGPTGPTDSRNNIVSSFNTTLVPSEYNRQPSKWYGWCSYHSALDCWVGQNIFAGWTGSGSYMAFLHETGGDTPWFAFDGSLSGLTVAPLTASAAPSVTATGIKGSTGYTYAIVAYGMTGSVASNPSTVTDGNATLDGSNYNRLQYTGTPGAVKYCVWRTASGGVPATTGKIACRSAIIHTDNNTDSGGTDLVYNFYDTGLAGDGNPLPGSNTTGVAAFNKITVTDSGEVANLHAATATALAADGTNCSAGNALLGVDAGGNAQGCWAVAAASHTHAAGDTTSGTFDAARIPAALSSTTSVNGTTIPASSTLTRTIASGAKALATSAIASGACTSAQTDTATGTLTTDTIIATFNADPTGVTGYAPSPSGMLTIVSYPTADTVNFKVCNNTGASITPGAITLNWRVVR